MTLNKLKLPHLCVSYMALQSETLGEPQA